MAISQITADAFAGGQYVDEISQTYIGNCHYDWETSRLIWDGDQLIHHWGVWGYAMRLENLFLKVAGVGAVVTSESFRKQGLMDLAARGSLKAMRVNGYDLSVLRGRHYVKYGYARAWNYVTYRLKPEEIPDLVIQKPYELLDPGKMEEINEMYNQFHQGFSGTCVRPTYSMLKADDMNAYGWFDEHHRLVGYVRAVPSDDKKTLQCLEAVGDPQQILAVLGENFKQGEYETLTFFTLPHQHPILRFLRKGACVVEDRYFHKTGWRVRIVNLLSTLEKISPLLEDRLRQTGYAGWRGDLYLDAGECNATLRIGSGSVQIIPGSPSEHSIQGGADIARFLIGSDEPDEIIQQADMSYTGESVELAKALFPNLHPVMSHWDEF